MFAFFLAALAVAIISIVAAVNLGISPEAYLPATIAQSNVSASSLLVVREAAWQYAKANPTVTSGLIPISSYSSYLKAPISNTSAFSVLIKSGVLYTWTTGSSAGLATAGNGGVAASAAYTLSDGSRLVGYKAGGILVSPTYGAQPSIALPSEVPDGAAVAIRPLI